MIEVKSLKKIYKINNNENVLALDDINLKFDKKGMVFILGKSGSGKSTLLNILAGLDNATEGEVLINGESLANFSQDKIDSYRNSYVGFIFQEYNLLEDFTLKENIEISLNLQGKEVKKYDLQDILKKVNLEKEINRKSNELSGGQIQRVAIARALIKNPEIIMADEPTGALDSKNGELILDLLKEFSKDKLVIVVSHDREFANKYADRIIEIADGKVINDVQLLRNNQESKKLIFKNENVFCPKDYVMNENDYKQIREYILANQKYKEIKIKSMNDCNFQETNQNDIEIENKSLNLKKSKLSLKNSIKIGANTLKRKITKLLTTIFLSVTAFMFLGVTLSIANYSLLKTEINTLQKAPYNHFVISKVDFENDGIKKEITEEDKNLISQKFNTNLIEVYDEVYIDKYISRFGNSNLVSNFSKRTEVKLVNLEEQKLETFNYKIIAGYFPKTQEEIAITDYIYQGFKDRDYIDEQNNYHQINSTSDILGKTLKLLDKNFTIVGIIDTNYNENQYQSIKEMTTQEIYTQKDYEKIMLLNKYSFEKSFIHTSIFFANKENFINIPTIMYLVGNMNKDKTTITELVNFSNQVNNNTRFSLLEIPLIYTLENINNVLKSIAKVFFILGLLFGTFSVLLLSNFIVSSINYKQKDIGILRAIGARKIDTFKIFMVESGIIAFINIILSFLFTNFANMCINNVIKKEIYIDNFIVARFTEYAILTIIISISSVFATYFAVKKNVSKTPIDTLQRAI